MLSHVRGRSLVVPAVLLVAAACAAPSSPRPAAPVPVPVAPAPVLPVPPVPAVTGADPTAPVPGPPLPVPVVIPADSYAPERVMEIGTMEIPAIGLTHRIYDGVTLHNIDRGPSHWTGSALPGQMGNAVFAGHRTSNDQPFRRIDELVPGDKVFFTVGGVRTTYRVTGHLVVTPADDWIANQSTAYTATLYACHPLGSTAERYVVQLAMEG
jgi:sortase A